MRLVALAIAGSLLGCATSRIPPSMRRAGGIPFQWTISIEPTLGEQVVSMVLPVLLVGGAVTAGYAAMGGGNPFR